MLLYGMIPYFKVRCDFGYWFQVFLLLRSCHFRKSHVLPSIFSSRAQKNIVMRYKFRSNKGRLIKHTTCSKVIEYILKLYIMSKDIFYSDLVCARYWSFRLYSYLRLYILRKSLGWKIFLGFITPNWVILHHCWRS